MGILSFFKSNKEIGKENQLKNVSVDLSNFRFVSSKHSKFEKGVKVGSIDGCWRGIQISKNTTVANSYFVSISTLDEQKNWKGGDVQMVIKHMKIGAVSNDKLELYGFGDDAMGVFFSDYGITIVLENNSVVKIILKYFYRNIELYYYK